MLEAHRPRWATVSLSLVLQDLDTRHVSLGPRSALTIGVPSAIPPLPRFVENTRSSVTTLVEKQRTSKRGDKAPTQRRLLQLGADREGRGTAPSRAFPSGPR